ncbi:MAG: right-handed parallel beta-helix repeat-containing protein [Ahniella sp.]|nr:right-handed parallel beta-helix repeat-containing protein [Ahniella sp.]
MTWPVPPPGFVYLYSTNDGYSNPRPIVIGGTGSPVLTLLPGTIVKLYEEACLQVGNTGAPGGLKANGVIFTSMRDNQGGDTDGTATAAATGDWNYVNLSATAVSDSCVFTNCEFRYGGNNGSAGMLMISAATPRIENSYIYESQTAGIYIIGANPQVVGCRFADNYRALDIRGRATAPGITGNQIEPQDNTPVIIDARCVPDIVSNNTFTARLDGKLNAIQLWETTIGTSMTWPVPPPGFVYLYSTNDGYSNPRPIVIGGTGSPVLTLLPGTIVKLYEEACLQVGNTGALAA